MGQLICGIAGAIGLSNGDRHPEAELGFAVLVVASGVRSALSSRWSMSDEGTLALMTKFYDQLQDSAVKSEAMK